MRECALFVTLAIDRFGERVFALPLVSYTEYTAKISLFAIDRGLRSMRRLPNGTAMRKTIKMAIVVALAAIVALTAWVMAMNRQPAKRVIERELARQFHKPIDVDIFAEQDLGDFEMIGFQFSNETTSSIGYCARKKTGKSTRELVAVKTTGKMIKRGTDIFVDHLYLFEDDDMFRYLVVLSLNDELAEIAIDINEAKTTFRVEQSPSTMSVISIPSTVSEFSYEFLDADGNRIP